MELVGSQFMKSRAVFAGSFDPLTIGHLDLIKRCANDFNELIILIGKNVHKNAMFTVEERICMIEEIIEVENLKNVKVDCSDLLVAKYCEQNDCNVLIRGLRNTTDFTFEQNIAYNNMYLNENLNTVFYLSKPEHIHISSSGIKEIIKFNESIKTMVHRVVYDRIRGKFENIQ